MIDFVATIPPSSVQVKRFSRIDGECACTYSARKASTGLTEAARRAGTKQATPATQTSSPVTLT